MCLWLARDHNKPNVNRHVNVPAGEPKTMQLLSSLALERNQNKRREVYIFEYPGLNIDLAIPKVIILSYLQAYNNSVIGKPARIWNILDIYYVIHNYLGLSRRTLA